jgi:large subunit ribosomal protein L21
MYAIVDINGQQFKVEKDRYIYTNKLDANVDDTLTFEKVLLTDNDGTVSVGTPTVSGAKVIGKVLEHVKGDKVIIFKKKRRKGHVKRRGFRHHFTKLQISEIVF